jgi:hypothetical protein
VCENWGKEPQVPPLRCAPVGMTILSRGQVFLAEALGSIPAPDFLCSFVGSAYRKFGASRSFARCGIPPASPSSLSRGPQLHTGAPCSHQRTWAENDGRPQISHFALLARATCAVLRKENRMKSINATGLHGKSGGKPNHSFPFRTLRLFIPTGGVMGQWPTQADEKRHLFSNCSS